MLIDDGVTDNSAALAAIVAAAPDNSVIALPPGIVCLASGLVVTGRNNITFSGGVLKMTGAASHPLGTLGNFGVVFDNCTSCGFNGTRFIGNGNGPVVGFKNCAGSGLWRCDVSGAGYGNAQVASIFGTRSEFISNNVHDSGGTETRGMWIGNVQTVEIDTAAMIRGNNVFNNMASGIVYVGVGGIVSNNRATGNTGSGIVIVGNADAHSFGVTVSGNSCSFNAFHGIQAGDSGELEHILPRVHCATGGAVSGNHCFSNVNAGVFVADAAGWSVSGNTCFDNGINGVQIDSNVYDIVVNGNVCFDSRTGAARTQTDGIKATGNFPDSFKGVSINGNVCTNHKARGIFVQSNSGALMKSLSIVGNSCNENDGGGIFIAESTGGKITGVNDGNSCRDNGGVDIRNTTTGVKNGTNTYATKMGF